MKHLLFLITVYFLTLAMCISANAQSSFTTINTSLVTGEVLTLNIEGEVEIVSTPSTRLRIETTVMVKTYNSNVVEVIKNSGRHSVSVDKGVVTYKKPSKVIILKGEPVTETVKVRVYVPSSITVVN